MMTKLDCDSDLDLAIIMNYFSEKRVIQNYFFNFKVS